MRDFTIRTYKLLLSALKENGYLFKPFRDFIKNPASRCIILRHDVDARKMNSLVCARLENEMGIKGTYYFRIVSGSFDEKIIRQICDLGHEIGYHYEDLALAHGDNDIAIKLFEEHLAKLRRVAPVETICMHGSPLSKYDNRKLWDKYNYRDYCLSGEPYLDTDFNQIMYLTDTGRRWDGSSVAIRDKTPKLDLLNDEMNEKLKYNFHSTFDIMVAARENRLPANIMITVHPQRWDDNMLPWLKELIWQNFKNIIKKAVAEKQKK
ncbi:MAG: hypothetical protein GX660_12240 [Clostridiaceae bacterium]|nr:hypothetical protein [Clostridiaceae bacterium]